MARTDIFIVAAEPSGDRLGADLARSLWAKSPDIRLGAIGGSHLSSAGLSSRLDVEGLAVLGYVEGLKAYPLVLKRVRQATDIILQEQPKSVVLIDSWGFMARLAKRLKTKGYAGKIIKYVAPQVWASRPGRAAILARHVDHLLSTQPMDRPHFDRVGLPMTFVGNPVLDRDYRAGDAVGFKRQHGMDADQTCIGLLFGSRKSEIERVGPAILKQWHTVKSKLPGAVAVTVISSAVRDQVETLIRENGIIPIDESAFVDALAAMDGAIACSGTVTTQLAAAGIPTVVLYKLSPITYALASRIINIEHMSLVNISASHEADFEGPLMPEFIQDDIHGGEPAEALLRIMQDEGISERLIKQTQRMGAGSENASDKAAAAILSLID